MIYKYEHIPPIFREYCYEDDKRFFLYLLTFLNGIIPRSSVIGTFIENYHTRYIERRNAVYYEIIAYYKIKISVDLHEYFEKETTKLIATARKYNPSSCLKYHRLCEWCENYVKANNPRKHYFYPNALPEKSKTPSPPQVQDIYKSFIKEKDN